MILKQRQQQNFLYREKVYTTTQKTHCRHFVIFPPKQKMPTLKQKPNTIFHFLDTIQTTHLNLYKTH